MTAHNGITSGSLCALNILRLTVVTRKTESYTKTKCSAESVIPQSIFFRFNKFAIPNKPLLLLR